MGMKYELSSPMVFGSPDSDEYRDGWDRIFGKKAKFKEATAKAAEEIRDLIEVRQVEGGLYGTSKED